MSTPQPAASSPTLQIVSIVFFTFISFLCVGLPIAVLPGYVHDDMGYGSVMAGVVISTQYLSTLLSRPMSGSLADRLGPKRAVIYGLASCGLSGVLTLLSTSLAQGGAGEKRWIDIVGAGLGRGDDEAAAAQRGEEPERDGGLARAGARGSNDEAISQRHASSLRPHTSRVTGDSC